MSGHSHFSSIKHKKETADAQRGQAFSKLARELTIAARDGTDPDANSKLRVVIEKARSVNMPKDNIERAINKGGDKNSGEQLEEVLFEAYGPGGTAVLVEGITDNRNRAVNEIRQILNQNGGKFVESGSFKWMFERKGVIDVLLKDKSKEEVELKAIEAGAQDIAWQEDRINIFTEASNLDLVKKALYSLGIEVTSTSLEWIPKQTIKADEKDKNACFKLFEALDENDNVNNIYSNLAD